MPNSESEPAEQESLPVNDLASSLSEKAVISPISEQQNPSMTISQPTEADTQEEAKVKDVIPTSVDPKPTTDTDFYLIKRIDFNYELLPILLQNVNGPCPLLAIFNILLLRKQIQIGPQVDAITTKRVVSLLAEYILERDSSKLSEEHRVNYERNVHDALAVLEKLQRGLDVNLKFDGVDKFEYTPECIIFDLLNIHLYHGWVIDPQDNVLSTIISKNASSYNQLVEKMIDWQNSDREELVREGLLIEQFLDENRSQLTHYGILQLNETMRENQLAVFFRNNHFSTIWKNHNQLLVLVSDQGYADHKSIVFETLTDVDNDSTFTDGYGRIWKKLVNTDSSRDRELAIALHQEEERLYHEAQLQEQRRSHEEGQWSQPKKSKSKRKKSSPSEDQKDSCTLS